MSDASHKPDFAANADHAAPLLAIVTGHLAPYLEHVHRRLVHELPEVRLATLVTKYRTNQWVNRNIPEINTVMLDPTPGPERRMSLGFALHEWRTARRLWRWLEENRPAAVVCAGYDELPNIWAVRWANRRHVPVLLRADSNVHGDLATGVKRFVKNAYLRLMCPRYSAFLVFGSVGRQFFHRYDVTDEKIFYMPLEPDYQAIEGMPAHTIEEVRERLALPAGRRRIVCCCRLIEAKRVDLVIDAFAQLADVRPEWDLVVIGDGMLRQSLEARAAAAVPDRVRIRFLGFQDQATLSAVYRSSDVLVLASNYEPWALVVNEAACAGMAVVCSSVVGAAAELVSAGDNGEVFPAGDLAGLRAALERVTDPARIDTLKALSRGVLARWRENADLVTGMRRALRFCGVLG